MDIKRNVGRYSSLSSNRMTGFVRKLIRKHSAHGHGEKVFNQKFYGKDWMHPKVRKAVEYMVERNVFDNRLDSRKNVSKFFERLFESKIILSDKEFKAELEMQTRSYLFELMRKKRVTNKKEFLNGFQINLELMAERVENLMNEIHSISPEKSKNNKGKKMKYYKMNARDAFAHSLTYMSIYPKLIHNIKGVVSRISREV